MEHKLRVTTLKDGSLQIKVKPNTPIFCINCGDEAHLAVEHEKGYQYLTCSSCGFRMFEVVCGG